METAIEKSAATKTARTAPTTPAPDASRDTYVAGMNAAIALAAEITRFAETGLGAAAHDWGGEQWLAHLCAEGIGKGAMDLVRASALGQVMSSPTQA